MAVVESPASPGRVHRAALLTGLVTHAIVVRLKQWGILAGTMLMAGMTQTCGEDESAMPLAPTPGPSAPKLVGSSGLVWESDLGEDMGFVGEFADDSTQVRSIGFEVEFYGTVETDITIDTNGNLTFGNTESHWGNSFPPPHHPRMIAPFYADLDPFEGGAVFFNLLGEAPNRRLVVTWFEIPYWNGTGSSTFQAQLFEGTNQIQFGYNGLLPDSGPGGGNNIGIARDAFEYIHTSENSESFAFDMTNICYTPDGDGYQETRAACESGPLTVACVPNPVLRGEPITCEASTQDPEAELEVIEWQFTDGQHVVTYEPPDVERPFWAGTMAVGGAVTVMATVDGDSIEASTTVSVQPREWHDLEQLPAAVQQACPLPGETLVFPCPLTYPPRVPYDFGSTDLYSDWRGSVFEVDSGPNEGWSMILSADQGTTMYAYKYLAHIVSYNPILDDPADTLWPAGCNVADMKNVVLNHEWQHVTLLGDSLAAADLPPNDRLERWVLFGPRDSLRVQLEDTLDVLDTTLNRYADTPVPHQVIPPTILPPNCGGFFGP